MECCQVKFLTAPDSCLIVAPARASVAPRLVPRFRHPLFLWWLMPQYQPPPGGPFPSSVLRRIRNGYCHPPTAHLSPPAPEREVH
jgi:hypothetical protein